MMQDVIPVMSSTDNAAHTLDNFEDRLNNIVTFQKRDGTTNQGTNYEVYVTSLVALRLALDEDVQELLIASNHSDFGAFDDVIVQVQRFGQTKENFAIQLKHKTKQKPIGPTFFTSEDFCILKYKESFLKVVYSVNSNNTDAFQNTTFCLFTNSVVEEHKLNKMRFKLREHLKKTECDFCNKYPEKHHHSTSLNFSIEPSSSTTKDFLLTEGNSYELKIHSLSNSVNLKQLEDYEKFFSKFKLYAGQMSSEEVKLHITDEFTQKFGISAQEVGEKFISFIDDWFFKKAESGWLTKEHIKLKILELLLTPFMIEPTITGVYLQQSSLWNSVVACANVTMVDEEVEDEDCLSKIYGAIEEKMRSTLQVEVNFKNWMEYVRKDVEMALKNRKLGSILNTVPEHGRINSKRLLIASWKMKFVPLVLRVNQSNKNDLTTILNASIGFNGLYIFVGKSPGKLKPGLKVLTNMSVNKSVTKILKILRYTSKYLNKCVLVNITALKKIMKALSDKVCRLKKVMSVGGLQILLSRVTQAIRILQTVQKRLKYSYKYMNIMEKNKTTKILRGLRKIHSTLSNIKAESAKYFRVNNGDNLQIQIIKATKLSIQGRRTLTLSDLVGSNTQRLNKIMRNITPSLLLRLLKTTTSTFSSYCVGVKLRQNASDYISRNFKWRRLIMNEMDLLNKFQNDTNVISGEPGMGKTTTLKSLAFHCNPRYWVLLINLNKIQEDFFNLRNTRVLDDPILYLFKKLEKKARAFTRTLFSHLRKCGKVVVILDSFDEVSPKYNDVVINLMKKIQAEKLRVWIATRPFAKSFIENAFSVHTIHMLGFTEQDFGNYLTLHNVSTCDKNFILANIDKNFYNIPLHAYMLTTVKNFSEEFEITDVYEKFINHKFDTFCRKHDLLQCKNNIDVLIQASRKELIKNHEVMALAVIYGVEFFKIVIAMNQDKLIQNFEEAVQITENCKNPLGLVVGVSNQIPVFIHRSYAEYMAAKWLFKNITRANVDYIPDIFSKLNPKFVTNPKMIFRNVNLYEKLFEPGHKLVRSMFDKMAAKGKPLHLAVLNSNLEKVKVLCEIQQKNDEFDVFGRTPLHLAVSVFDPHTSFLSSYGEINRNKCEILSTLVDYFENKTSIDFLAKDAFGWDFFRYAKLSGNEDLPHVAAQYGELKSLALFLNYLPEAQLKCIIDKKIAKNMTLLNVATARGHVNIVKYLVGKGADKEARDSTGNTVFQVACKSGCLDLVRFLLDAGVNKNTFNQFGNTSLHLAAKHGHFEIVKLLVEVGSDVNVCNNSREAPLHVAAANGHLLVVEYLIGNGADVVAEDVNASTPSYLAAERGQVNVVKYLTEKEAEIYKSFISQNFVGCYFEVNKECNEVTQQYIVYLATLYALKFTLCEENEEVRIALHFEEYGKFGDLVIQNISNETSETIAMGFICCCENISPKFDVQEMNKSYNSLKTALPEHYNLYLCLQIDCASVSDDQFENSLSHFKDITERRCYKLATYAEEQEEFLSKLRLYYGLFDCKIAVNLIRSLLKDAGFGQADDDVIKNIVANFHHRKERHLLSKSEIKVKLLECLLTPFLIQPEIYVPLGIDRLVWDELINTSDVTLINNCSSEDWKLVRRIFYTMQMHVKDTCGINLNMKLWMQHKNHHPIIRYFPCIKKFMVMLWEKKVLPLFLQINSQGETNFVSVVLNKLLSPSSHKCIIMADDFNHLKLKSDLKIFDRLKIASEDVKMRILQRTEVVLQGRTSINLLKLTDKFDANYLSSTFLVTMNKSNAICKSLEHRVEFYVGRRFFKTFLRAEVLWKTEGNVFILDHKLNFTMSKNCGEVGISVIKLFQRLSRDEVVGSILKAESTNIIIEEVNENEMTSLYHDLKSNGNLAFLKVHCLKVDGDYLEWVKSSDGVKDLNDFFVQIQTVDERALLECFKNSLNVISAVAGMGKTTVLQSLARSCDPDHFVLPINLREFQRDFKQKYESLLDDPLDYFYQKLYGHEQVTLDVEVFKICNAQKKVVVFMDNFESMIYWSKDFVLQVIEKLNQKNVKVWIATRPIAVHFLQEKFNVLPVNLQEINDAEKQYYLNEVLYVSSLQERNFLYSKSNTSFYRIPLHLNILAKHINSEKLSVLFFEFDINWYKNFIQDKIRTIHEHDGKNSYTFESLELKCAHLFQTLALVSVYGKNFVLSNNASHEEYLDEIIKDVLRCTRDAGFIAVIKDNVPIFTHEMYRDYFLATWLLQNIHYSKCQEMYRLLFEPGFQSARHMFDKFAATGCPVHLAVLSNNVAELQRLCQASNKPTLRDQLGRTPLHLAVSHFKHLEFNSPEHRTSCTVVSLIIDLLKTADKAVYLQDNLLKWNWLRYATESGNLELFHLAALHGHINIMELFLKISKGQYINKPCRSGYTPLDMAISRSHIDVIKFLLRNGITKSDMKLNFLKAAAEGKTDVVKLFVEEGADINYTDSNEQNALHKASLNGSLECVKYLLSRRLSVESKTKDSHTPLHFAVQKGHLSIVNLLIKMKADVNAANTDGQTPLHLAIINDQEKSTSSLLYAHADVNVKDKVGHTPVAIAIAKNHQGILALLLTLRFFEVSKHVGGSIEGILKTNVLLQSKSENNDNDDDDDSVAVEKAQDALALNQ